MGARWGRGDRVGSEDFFTVDLQVEGDELSRFIVEEDGCVGDEAKGFDGWGFVDDGGATDGCITFPAGEICWGDRIYWHEVGWLRLQGWINDRLFAGISYLYDGDGKSPDGEDISSFEFVFLLGD